MNVLITDNPLDVVGYDLVIDLSTDKKIDTTKAISIFSIDEENAAAMRTEILAWLDSIKHLNPCNKNASRALRDFKSESLWQINRLNERCNFGKLDQLDGIFKIIAINYFVKNKTHYSFFLDIKKILNEEINDNLSKQGINFQNLARGYQGFVNISCFWDRGLFMNFFKSLPWLAMKL